MAYVPHFPPRIHLLSTEMNGENPFSMENHDNLKNHSLGYIWSPAIISLRELGLNLEYYQQVLISK